MARRESRNGVLRARGRWLMVAGLGFSILVAQACGSDGGSDVAATGDGNLVAVDLVPVSGAGEPLTQVDPKALDETVKVLQARLDDLKTTLDEAPNVDATVSINGKRVTVEMPETLDEQHRRAVMDAATNPGRLGFRPVLGVLPPVPSEADRAQLEERVTDLHKSLGLPEDVTAQDLLNEVLAGLHEQQQEGPANAKPTWGRENQYGIDVHSPEFTELAQAEAQLSTSLTPPRDIAPDKEVVIADSDGQIYRLGPTFTHGGKTLDGGAIADATAGRNQQGEWVVNPEFNGGADGIDLFNAAATACYNGEPICPPQQGGRGQVAIVLDGEVLTAPSINEPTFARDQIQISGSFDKQDAQSVAIALRHGSLPLQLAPS